MSIKKFIAYITAISIVALSFGMTAFAADKPTADAGTTVCDGAYIVGSYTYTGEQPQGNSIYRWYISDSFSDKGTLAEGQDGLTFKASNATAGKFITFAVVPVDENGNQGDEVCADPVMQNSGYYEDFSSTPAGLETLTTAEGHVKIVNDPAGGEDMALSVYKKSSSSFKTEARLNFDSVAAAKTVVDVQLYATDIAGTAKLFGVYCDAYGSVMELQTDASGKLYYRGGNGLKQAVVDFPTDSWNHLVMEINGEDKTVKATLNGNNIFRDSDTESWRFKNDEYNNVAASFLNYGNGGTVYIKNLVVMDVSGEISAQADAEWLEDAVPYEAEKDITLPSTGKNGSYIYWKSSMPQYITDEGVVTRPKYEEGNVDV
ncbi:MAG: hypothetical protein IJ365_02780, partial [Clostridia bacterium]|nr:hypothetical protein [Clostridia bacterium]